jgi:hypothetical protein
VAIWEGADDSSRRKQAELSGQVLCSLKIDVTQVTQLKRPCESRVTRHMKQADTMPLPFRATDELTGVAVGRACTPGDGKGRRAGDVRVGQ